MGYQRKKRFRSFDDGYGPAVAGHRYKKYRPEPLAITLLKIAAERSAVFASAQFLLDAISDQITSNVGKKNFPNRLTAHHIQKSLHYLKRKNFIAFPGKGRFTITAKGKARLSKIKLDKIKVVKPGKWDGKWRLLTFDIPEEKTRLRDYFRKRLKEIGFYHFQRSVFVIPYPCKEEIDMMCDDLGIMPNVHLITAERFEGDEDLVKKYNLMPY